MGNSKNADIDHSLSKAGLYDTVSHADDEQEEEGEGVARRVQDRNNDHHRVGKEVFPMRVLVFCKGYQPRVKDALSCNIR